MVKVALFPFLFFISFLGIGQKTVKKSILDEGVSIIQIDVTQCFEAIVKTVPNSNEITIEAKMEGEYRKDLDVAFQTKGNTLFVNPGLGPSFIDPNDKLSAHKVVSLALLISIPEWQVAKIFGTSARVVATGNFKNLTVILADGSCQLFNVDHEATVRTQSGNIEVATQNGIVYAESKYGHVSHNPIPKGFPLYHLNTITGNISLKKTE